MPFFWDYTMLNGIEPYIQHGTYTAVPGTVCMRFGYAGYIAESWLHFDFYLLWGRLVPLTDKNCADNI